MERKVITEYITSLDISIMATTDLKSVHYTHSLPSDPSKAFRITCPSRTDIWNKPPDTHSFNAPIIYHTFKNLSQFSSATVNISSSWTQKYDQGGLCLIINPSTPGHKSTWLKTGIEFLNSQVHVSTVATRTWSDWSLRPLATDEKNSSTSSSATVKIVNNAKDDGSLWVYLQSADGSVRLRPSLTDYTCPALVRI